jgi:hypothetical protein
MRYLTFVTFLFSAHAAIGAESAIEARYRNQSGPLALTVTQNIWVQDHDAPIADRKFAFDLSFQSDAETGRVTVTLDAAKASYTAHDMTERIGTRHLTGQSFVLSSEDGGRSLQVQSEQAPVVGLGPMVPAGFSIADFLADVLPMLSEGSLGKESTWTTERVIRSLEGWGYGAGRLQSRHRVTSVERRNDHVVLSVETDADAALGPVSGERRYEGAIQRSLRWKFDATEGRLLLLSLEQEGHGTAELPQGEIPIRQKLLVQIAPRR